MGERQPFVAVDQMEGTGSRDPQGSVAMALNKRRGLVKAGRQEGKVD